MDPAGLPVALTRLRVHRVVLPIGQWTNRWVARAQAPCAAKAAWPPAVARSFALMTALVVAVASAEQAVPPQQQQLPEEKVVPAQALPVAKALPVAVAVAERLMVPPDQAPLRQAEMIETVLRIGEVVQLPAQARAKFLTRFLSFVPKRVVHSQQSVAQRRPAVPIVSRLQPLFADPPPSVVRWPVRRQPTLRCRPAPPAHFPKSWTIKQKLPAGALHPIRPARDRYRSGVGFSAGQPLPDPHEALSVSPRLAAWQPGHPIATNGWGGKRRALPGSHDHAKSCHPVPFAWQLSGSLIQGGPGCSIEPVPPNRLFDLLLSKWQ